MILTSLHEQRATSAPNFTKFIPTASEIAALKADYWRVVESWTPERILGAMGYINLVTFKIAMQCGALYQVDDNPKRMKNTYAIDKELLGELLERSAAGRLSYQVATKGVSKYLSEYWESAANSMPTLRKIREAFSKEFGLFTYERIEASGRICDCPAPQWRQIDFVGLLILHEVLEELLCDGNTSGIEMKRKKDELPSEMPEHRGFWTVMLYNAVFEGVQEFHRAIEEPSLFTFSWGYADEEDYNEVAEDVWAIVAAKVEEETAHYLKELEPSW